MRVCKIFDWCYGHWLDLPYESKCSSQHGHNSKIEIEIEGPVNKHGMIIDFSQLKNIINRISFDHKNLNDIFYFNNKNPTAENIVLYLKEEIDKHIYTLNKFGSKCKLRRIRVYETRTSFAEEVWK